jgi:hypothetical protein
LEQIIRPFQLQDPASTARIPVIVGQVDVQPAHLCWGGVGTLPMAVLQADDFNGENFRLEECDDQQAEDTRDTENFDIVDQNNPNNKITAQRIRRINFKKTSKQHFLGVFHTDTTDFDLPDFFAGSGFGDVPEEGKCKSTFSLNR